MEDEFHVLCVCPEYAKPRADLLDQLAEQFTLNSTNDLLQLISTCDAVTMRAVGSFLVRVRQTRRRLKNSFEQLNEKFNVHSFASKRVAWRLRGKASCRHGVLFAQLPASGCKCMNTDSTDMDWIHAKHMPALSASLKCIVAVRFDRHTFKRLAVLQAEARAMQW